MLMQRQTQTYEHNLTPLGNISDKKKTAKHLISAMAQQMVFFFREHNSGTHVLTLHQCCQSCRRATN